MVRKVGDLYEENVHELFALTTREAGKSLLDAVAEIREAVDFAMFYANEGVRYKDAGEALGVVCCISPGTSRWPSSLARSWRTWRQAMRSSPSRRSRPHCWRYELLS